MAIDFSSYANMTGIGNVKFPGSGGSSFNTAADLGNFSNSAIESAGAAAGLDAFSSSFDASGISAAAFGGSGGWTFITTPENIEWSMSAEVSPVKIFGTNQVPVTVGSKGMRELNMGNALVEGFSRKVQVEDKVAALEALMNFSLVSGDKSGYVKVPVFQVTANDKIYGSGQGGSDGGYFVIKDIKVKEVIRDLAGLTTRAYVDVAFTQVPPYQVSSGIDQANKSVTGAKATALTPDATAATKNTPKPTPQQAATNAVNSQTKTKQPPVSRRPPAPRQTPQPPRVFAQNYQD